ncbi:hypothetical protein AKJ65_04300 [candidate division MSBL1 archaeon SCGC-AAA259E19]|uniref:Uncharacterized protein n=1 Tax=candidate division MSBL1 archaeon SCGC-AAA259E19 TaxID=1698264 RepID=A0A133UJT2_9EURY|nr:hypothetical protein AKJ65_04300 [candidate division MSBL1 archaeon SCGC-AAA259E19]
MSGQNLEAEEGKIPDGGTTPFLVTEEGGYVPVSPHGESQLYDIKEDVLAENNIVGEEGKI